MSRILVKIKRFLLECAIAGERDGPLPSCHIQISRLQSHRFCVWFQSEHGSQENIQSAKTVPIDA